MNEADLKKELEKAAGNLLKRQPDFFTFTSETTQSEWNIAHHLAIEVAGLFPDLSCDLDVIKPNYENRRPDIVLHRRGSHGDNFLVIEVKRHRDDVERDLGKIKQYWFRGELHYRFGAVVVINETEPPFAEVLTNPDY
jgi:hypothetical protein